MTFFRGWERERERGLVFPKDLMLCNSANNEQDYLVSRMETRPVGPADLVMFCHGGSHSEELDQSRPESMSKDSSILIQDNSKS